MSILKNQDGTELYIDCYCCCDNGIRIKIYKEKDKKHTADSTYAIVTYTNGNFYREQNDSVWGVLFKKIKKIWAIIINKDFYYSEIVLNKNDFDELKKCLNDIE